MQVTYKAEIPGPMKIDSLDQLEKIKDFGILPANLVYISTYEFVKMKAASTFQWEFFAHLLGGGLAALMSGLISVPTDVISQRMMLRITKYPEGQNVFKLILKQEGFRGLYRGFVASLFTQCPSSAIWWASYSSAKNQFLYLQPEFALKHLSLCQAISGLIAGTVAAFITNPLDTIKTRLQTMEKTNLSSKSLPSCHNGNSVSWWSIASKLYSDEGIKGFYRGIFARITSVAPVSMMSILIYEFIKKNSIRQKNN